MHINLVGFYAFCGYQYAGFLSFKVKICPL